MPSVATSTASAVKLPGLTLNLQPVILALLFVALFAGCQGGRYYFANRLQELGIASAMALFVLGAWRGLFCIAIAEWRQWVLGACFLIFGILLVSAVVFSVNFEGNVLYSFLSAREFMLAFVGPGVYLLCRCGLPLASVERVVWLVLVALMLNYLFFYFTMDLRAAFFSSDHTVSNLVTYDEWRGFRLKPPLFAIMVVLLGALMLLLQSRVALTVFAALGILGLAGVYLEYCHVPLHARHDDPVGFALSPVALPAQSPAIGGGAGAPGFDYSACGNTGRVVSLPGG